MRNHTLFMMHHLSRCAVMIVLLTRTTIRACLCGNGLMQSAVLGEKVLFPPILQVRTHQMQVAHPNQDPDIFRYNHIWVTECICTVSITSLNMHSHDGDRLEWPLNQVNGRHGVGLIPPPLLGLGWHQKGRVPHFDPPWQLQLHRRTDSSDGTCCVWCD